jgi:DNA invertase Pin-like site-specific DNA recombinase
MENLPEKAVLLIRVSTEKQDFEYQKAELLEYVLKEKEFTEEQILSITAKESGLLDEDDRESLRELEKAINSTEFTVKCVYVLEMSRFSRRPYITAKWVEKFEEKGLNFKSKNEYFTLFDKSGNVIPASKQWILSLLSAVQQNSDFRTNAIKGGIRFKSENGFCQKNNLFYGYKHDEKNKDIKGLRNKIVINENEAEKVKLIFDLYETGKYGSGMLRRELERKGTYLTREKIIRILGYRLYTGESIPCEWKKKDKKTGKYKTSTYKRQLPQIISLEQFQKCREIALKQNSKPVKSKHIHFGNHLIKCSCGEDLTTNNHGKQTYYVCSHCNSGINISYKVMDSILWWVAKGYEIRAILNVTQGDIEKEKKSITEYYKSIENTKQALEKFKKKTLNQWKKQMPYLSETDLEQIFAKNPEKDTFEDNIKRFYSEIKICDIRIKDLENKLNLKQTNFVERYGDFIEEIKQNPQILEEDPEKIETENIETLEQAYEIYTRTNENMVTETFKEYYKIGYGKTHVSEADFISAIRYKQQFAYTGVTLDISDDFKKNEIINKYVKEVRITEIPNEKTPTLKIVVNTHSHVSNDPLIYNFTFHYAYRQMNENKRLCVIGAGNKKNYLDWKNIYLEKFVDKKEKTINKRSADRVAKKNALVECYNTNHNLTAVQYQKMLQEIGVVIPLPSIFVYLREIKKS